MKLLNFKKNNRYSLGVKTPKGILDIEAADGKLNASVPGRIEELIEGEKSKLQAFEELVKKAMLFNDETLFIPEENIHFGPALTNPEKIICVGLNYIEHAEEAEMMIPTSPILFSKFNNTLSAHCDTVKLPQIANQYDYEAELVIVIGKTARNVTEENALSYVFGYCAGNDLSVRDLQMKTSQWLIGKTCDGFAPLGPYIVTSDEVGDPNNLRIESRVNGEVRQSSNTKYMIFNCAAIISYASKIMTLKPGDLIFTGTPSGVILGYPPERQKWLKAGDEIVVTIEKMGELKTYLA